MHTNDEGKDIVPLSSSGSLCGIDFHYWTNSEILCMAAVAIRRAAIPSGIGRRPRSPALERPQKVLLSVYFDGRNLPLQGRFPHFLSSTRVMSTNRLWQIRPATNVQRKP